MAHDSLSPRIHVRVRHFRHEGLIRFRVFEFAALLPLLLQIALVLFFLGLVQFLQALHPTIGYITTSLVVVWILVLISSTLAPILSSRCPYKTPILKHSLQALYHPCTRIRCFIRAFASSSRPDSWPELFDQISFSPVKAFNLFNHVIRTLLQNAWSRLTTYNFRIRLTQYYLLYMRSTVHEQSIRSDDTADLSSLATTFATFMDDDLLEAIRECLTDSTLDDTLTCVRNIVMLRSNTPIHSLETIPVGSPHLTPEGWKELTAIVQSAVQATLDRLFRLRGFASFTHTHTMHEYPDLSEALTFIIAWHDYIDREDFGEIIGKLFEIGGSFTQEGLVQLYNFRGFSNRPGISIISEDGEPSKFLNPRISLT